MVMSPWELDALEPRVMRKLIKDSINSIRDQDLWDERVEYEEGEKDKLLKVAENWNMNEEDNPMEKERTWHVYFINCDCGGHFEARRRVVAETNGSVRALSESEAIVKAKNIKKKDIYDAITNW